MVTIFLSLLGCMICSGFALYSEGAGYDSWQHAVFGWIIPMVGGSERLHTLHHLGMWGLVSFVMIHIYSVLREDIMSSQDMVSTMINGHRAFKEKDH
jgi:Ni/Fe-hydrogenase 1 B-type cytochrome subunit